MSYDDSRLCSGQGIERPAITVSVDAPPVKSFSKGKKRPKKKSASRKEPGPSSDADPSTSDASPQLESGPPSYISSPAGPTSDSTPYADSPRTPPEPVSPIQLEAAAGPSSAVQYPPPAPEGPGDSFLSQLSDDPEAQALLELYQQLGVTDQKLRASSSSYSPESTSPKEKHVQTSLSCRNLAPLLLLLLFAFILPSCKKTRSTENMRDLYVEFDT